VTFSAHIQWHVTNKALYSTGEKTLSVPSPVQPVASGPNVPTHVKHHAGQSTMIFLVPSNAFPDVHVQLDKCLTTTVVVSRSRPVHASLKATSICPENPICRTVTFASVTRVSGNAPTTNVHRTSPVVRTQNM